MNMKTIPLEQAVAMIPDGASVMIGGFMGVGTPERVVDELVRQGKRDLTVIEQLEQWRGLPKAIRLDNGPELTSICLTEGCQRKGIDLRCNQPGKPNQNACIERYNRSYRSLEHLAIRIT